MSYLSKLTQERAFLRRELLTFDKFDRLRDEGREPEMTFDRFGRAHVRATKPAPRKPAAD